MSNSSGTRRRRIDVDQYYRMAEVGILGADERVELIDGDILTMPPIGSRHSHAVGALMRALVRALPDSVALVTCQNPMRLSRFSEPQPDLLVLRPKEGGYREAHPSATETLLLMEVSDTTLRYDLGRKLRLYARHEVPEVWVLDLNAERLHMFREPRAFGYESRLVFERGTAVALQALPDVLISWDLALGPRAE